MTSCTNPCRAVHREPGVTTVAHDRLPGVETHPHLDLDAIGPVVGEEGLLTVDRGQKCIACAAKATKNESPGVHLVAPMGDERSTEEASMISENRRIALAQLLDELCRTLDVGEEERDGTGRNLGHAAQAWTVIVRKARGSTKQVVASR